MLQQATFIIGLAMFFLQPATATVLRVSKSGSGTDGLSWETAFPTVNEAMTASASGDEIWMASGTYVEAVRMKDGARLFGGFSGEVAPDEFALRDPEVYGTVLSGTRGPHPVLQAGNHTILDGLYVTWGGMGGIACENVSAVITNCVIHGNHNSFQNKLYGAGTTGGGVYCSNATVEISNCRITSNRAGHGAGVYAHNGSDLRLADNVIAANFADHYSGSFFNDTLGEGAGVRVEDSAVRIEKCLFQENRSAYGGGVYIANASEALILECRFLLNVALGHSTVPYSGATFGLGGGVYGLDSEVTVSNCLFIKNGSGRGGGIAFKNSEAEADNCTFVGNTGHESSFYGSYNRGGAVSVEGFARFRNCIFNENQEPEVWALGWADVRYSLLQWPWPGEGNLIADPLFEDPAQGSYKLSPNSPCIDSGSAGGPVADLEGYPRPIDIPGVGRDGEGSYDMGAYEFDLPGTIRPTWTPTPAVTSTRTQTPTPFYTPSPTPGQLVRIIQNPSSAESSFFGASMAISGNKLIVGCPSDGTGAERSGSVFVFDRESFEFLFQIPNPFPQVEDRFGLNVSSLRGKILVGPRVRGFDDLPSRSGLVFDDETGSLLFDLNIPEPTPASGSENSIVGYGDKIYIGSPLALTTTGSQGVVYVYDGESGDLIDTIENPFPDGDLSRRFGQRIAVNDEKVVIVAQGDPRYVTGVGMAHVYDSETLALLDTIENPRSESEFGSSIAIVGNTLLIGHTRARRVYRVHLDRGDFAGDIESPIGDHDIFFGRSISGEGGHYLIGAPSSRGFAYLFEASSGMEILELSDPTLDSSAGFGQSVVLDGDRLVIGAPYAEEGRSARGRVYVYTLARDAYPTVTPSQTPLPTGTSTPKNTPTRTNTRPPYTPKPTNTPVFPVRQIGSPTEHPFIHFGSAVSSVPDFTGDGFDDLAVGAPQEGEENLLGSEGRVHLYDGRTGDWKRTLVSPNKEGYANFGFSLTGLPDTNGNGGGELAVGAFQEPSGSSVPRAGRAYVFDGSTGEVLGALESINPQNDGFFGFLLSLEPDTNENGFVELLVQAVGEGIQVESENPMRRKANQTPLMKPWVSYLFDSSTYELLEVRPSNAEPSEIRFGKSLGGFRFQIPDRSGDDISDTVVGVVDSYSDPEGRGRVDFYSSIHIWDWLTLRSPHEEPRGSFGWSGALLRSEIDETANLAVSALYEDSTSGSRDSGRVYLYELTSDLFPTATPSHTPSTTFTPSPSPTETPTAAPSLQPTFSSDLSDMDGDGKVDARDLLLFLKGWKESNGVR